MKKLAERNRDKVIDLLTERLAFERTAVKLYDSIVLKLGRRTDPEIARLMPQLKEHHDQEREHEAWLEVEIRVFGGDTHAETDLSRLIEIESEGFEKVVHCGDGEPVHLLHALLSVELVDTSGWQLLLELADAAEDDDARRGFRQRLHEEEDHLIFARHALERLTRLEVLGHKAFVAAAHP